jgi:hypothetical protein
MSYLNAGVGYSVVDSLWKINVGFSESLWPAWYPPVPAGRLFGWVVTGGADPDDKPDCSVIAQDMGALVANNLCNGPASCWLEAL